MSLDDDPFPINPLFVFSFKDFSKYVDMPSDEWLDGTVVSLTNYGAFVRLDEGVDGMVHISQMDPQGQRIDSVYDYMQVSREGALFLWRQICLFASTNVEKERILAPFLFYSCFKTFLGVGIELGRRKYFRARFSLAGLSRLRP